MKKIIMITILAMSLGACTSTQMKDMSMDNMRFNNEMIQQKMIERGAIAGQINPKNKSADNKALKAQLVTIDADIYQLRAQNEQERQLMADGNKMQNQGIMQGLVGVGAAALIVLKATK